ncbi:hypothetical protein L484_013397 [Morus notabilis]|uniref:Uncharacterized protein n=1 Tax=Morus notabilis TaxID=981085 RepID=W9R768_9ROSA|nr:hypothetical protein L484_013397 [Morus notabilis]
MEVTIQEVPGEHNEFVVRVAARFTITATWAEDDSDIKRWIQRIQKIYRPKNRRRSLVVGLCADRSLNYANGTHVSHSTGVSLKDHPYELLQICVGNHCVMCTMDSTICSWGGKWFPKALKDLLHDGGVTVVGVGIDKFGKKMEKDYGWMMPNKAVELRDLAAQLRGNNGTPNNPDGQTTRDFSRFGLARLARAVLGEEVNFVKPNRITWCNSHWIPCYPQRLTKDMIKYASVEAFLTSYMGATLLDLATAKSVGARPHFLEHY